jgi:FkbM family methyltransferase
MGYSQNNEEVIICNYFVDTIGTFLDIGANDGKTLSNTAKLVELGWEGVMVEPAPDAFSQLEKTYLYNKRVQPINCAISDKAGVITFYNSLDTLISSISEDAVKMWKQPYTAINVQSLTYKLLLEEVSIKDFDFISIDAEGFDLIILKQIDLTNTKMICIEHGNSIENFEAMLNYCEGFGMKLILRNFENLIMAR